VAAVHTAADAVTRIAAEDREAVRAAAANHRLYVPSFAHTNAAVVRRRYRAASPSRIDEILASYDDAIEASARATSKLDDLALGLDAPTWPLATLRGRPQRFLRAFGPGETPAPKGSPVRPPPSQHRRPGQGLNAASRRDLLGPERYREPVQAGRNGPHSRK
jgi:hypothetical protein